MSAIIRSAVNSLASFGFIDLLQNNKFEIIGTDVTEEGLGKMFCDKYYKVPFAKEGKLVIDHYKKIIIENNAKWIISGPENEIMLLAKYSSEFEEIGCQVLHSPEKTLIEITDKWKLYKKTINDIPNPLTISVNEILQDESLINKFEDKIVLKPKEGRGSNDVYILRKKEAIDFIKNNNLGNDFVCQKFLIGKEYSVDTLHDLEGKLLNTVIRERSQTDSGISVVSKTLRNEKIFQHIEKLSSIFEFRGASCIQFIESNGEFFLTDINPRFGGGSILSISASKTFQNNIFNLLNNKNNLLEYNSKEYEIKTMYRSYKEFYKK